MESIMLEKSEIQHPYVFIVSELFFA